MTFVPSTSPPGEEDRPALRFLFHGDRMLVVPGEGAAAVPLLDGAALRTAFPPLLRSHRLGTLDGVPCIAGELAGAAVPEGMSLSPLRPLLDLLPEPLFAVAGRAFQVVDWDRGCAFCGRCGSATAPLAGERGRSCTSCGKLFFPPVSPAVIVAVVREGKILLARGRRAPPSSFHSVLAGFVEPGESLEECVRREVKEEAGIELAGVRYFGSQPWPFPHSLMVGFTAEWAGGEIVPEEKEIAEAAWYSPAEAASLRTPPGTTISGRLIGWFLRTGGAGEP